MGKDISTEIDKVRYQRWTNGANNAKNDIARAFFEFAFTLKQIKDNGYYDYKYENFKDYCEYELQIDGRTAYDYVKIADFVIENHKYLTTEKAGLLGHKKLKLLAQKLSKIERQRREEILRSIEERETFTQLKQRVESRLKELKGIIHLELRLTRCYRRVPFGYTPKPAYGSGHVSLKQEADT